MKTCARLLALPALLILLVWAVPSSADEAPEQQPAEADTAAPALETLQRLQAERTAFARALAPSVVAVAATKPNLDDMAQASLRGSANVLAATGFVVDGSYVLTCMDTGPNIRAQTGRGPTQYLNPGERVWLMAHDGTEFQGTVTGRDRRNLLVVIRMDTGHPELPSLRLGDSDAVEMGTTAVGLGNTLDSMLIDQVVSFSYGTVSGSYRFEPVDVLQGGDIATHGDPYKGNVLETDVAVHSGDHGGPLVNLRGEVIGMLNGHFMVGRHLGCAVPINQIRAVLPQLKRGIREDDLARGWLGFSVLSDPANPKTIEISRVDEDSPASKAGLEAGWHITRVDNYVIPSQGWLREMLGVSPLTRDIRTPARGPFSPPGERTVWVSYGMPVGTYIQLTVRNPESGDEKTVSLKVAERTEDF